MAVSLLILAVFALCGLVALAATIVAAIYFYRRDNR